MNRVPSNKDIILKGTFPYAYGDGNALKICYNRVLSLLPTWNINDQKTLLEKRKMYWVQQNKNFLENGTKDLVVNLPFQRLFLGDLTLLGFLKIDGNNITAPKREIEKINKTFLWQGIKREILLVFIVGLTKQMMAYRHLEHSLGTTLVYATFIGLIKGLVKSLGDKIIYGKENVASKMPLKCIIDVGAEVATALFIVCSGKNWYSALKGGLKGCLKYGFKHYLERTVILITFTELCLEVFQSGFKAYLRAYSYWLLINWVPAFIPTILSPVLCCYPGALLGALLMNIFIDHCTL